MKKDKLKNVDIRYFLIPFFILLLLFSLVTYTAVKRAVEEKYLSFEKQAIGIAESYSHALVYSHDARDIISDLLNEKLMVAIQAISMIEDKYDDDALSVIGDRFMLDEIHLYNEEGEIIYSKGGKYLGWIAEEGHPVHNFMISDKKLFVEEIRKDSESDNYYKYAYIKNEDGTFIQIGILADTINTFLRGFEIHDIMNSLSDRDDIINVLFTDTDFQVIAGSLTKYTGKILANDRIKEQVLNEHRHASRTILNGMDVFQVWVPVIHDGEVHGVLSVIWSIDDLKNDIVVMILNTILLFFAVILVFTVILYYAYVKNRSHILIAYYDKLTGLPNHHYLIEYLDDAVKSLNGKKRAVFLLNCRNFDTINMTYGFNYGNEIIRQIADKVKGLIEPKDRLFRFGADRFVLVVNDYDSKGQLSALAERIVDQFKTPITDNKQQYIDVELSIVEIKHNKLHADRLLQDATLALDCIDEKANERICFYQEVMESAVVRQDKIEKTLIRIINGEDKHSLTLHYQPKWYLKKNCLIGFESLARLKVEGLGNVSPLEFIDIAEKRLLIYDLGKKILDKACKFIKKLNYMGYENIKVSVNISVIQLLRDEFVKDLLEIIESAEIDKRSLVLEITETIIMENFDLINEKLEEVKRNGISISLDDFGTGFSSLARLSDLYIDYVKIDRHFINNISKSNEDMLITADIISMSHKFGLIVVAEGVEKEEQKKYLEENDCDILQGYLISKPLDEESAIKFISEESAVSANLRV